jgi:hypothetical protein
VLPCSLPAGLLYGADSRQGHQQCSAHGLRDVLLAAMQAKEKPASDVVAAFVMRTAEGSETRVQKPEDP